MCVVAFWLAIHCYSFFMYFLFILIILFYCIAAIVIVCHFFVLLDGVCLSGNKRITYLLTFYF